ncbi:hypothetical protein TNCV_2318101 [Trichonephila clavipes]|nr:hypothetical protein TNCV_2318101 [Trichonephila clavipes]
MALSIFHYSTTIFLGVGIFFPSVYIYCVEAGLFPLIANGPLADRCGKVTDISLIAGKKFRNWVVKDVDPVSQAVPTVKKRHRNIVLSFPHDSVTTARLKTYNVHLDIGVQRARDQMSRD